MTRARVWVALTVTAVVGFGAFVAGQAGTAKTPGNIWPPAMKGQVKAVPLSPQDAMKTFSLPPGYRVELVASEPMIESPILIDFDPDGRMYVLEQLTFLPDTSGRDSEEPLNRVSVLEDTNNDGVMDKKTVFADKLRMPRALKVLNGGVLIGEPPNLWFMKDTNGDLVADTKEVVVNTYGRPEAGIEHNANSLYWAMDNIMYSSEHTWDLRLKNGKFEPLPTLSRGQWQVSQDDAGRIYRNVNDSPIFVDYTPARYFMRNPNAPRTRGLYELLIEQMDATTYPVRDTRGVNRGYRDPLFRADGSAIVIMGAGTPTIYRGTKYPVALRGAGFITDSPTNLVHAMSIINTGGKLSAKNVFARGEIIASSDERFRPVSLFDAPDGNMYVVDMYRGIVQAGGIWSPYLREYIETRQMHLPVGRGRIWRIVYGPAATARGPKPSLGSATPAQLVETLSNPTGWWRDTAQQLLVQRGDKSVVPSLKTLAGTAPDWRTKLHALWTLDGLDSIEPADVQKALADPNPDVRAAGVRISERWLGQPDQTISAAVVKLAADPHWTVRRQVAASIGELPAAARIDPAVTILARDGADAIVVDAVVSSLKGVENEVLTRVLQARAPVTPPAEAVSMLTAAVTKTGNVPRVQELIALATTTTEPMWRRTAILQGLDTALPAGAGGRGGRGGGGGGGGLAGLSSGPRVTIMPGQAITLPTEPVALNKIAEGTSDFAYLAGTVVGKLNWPGRPAPVVRVTPLTAEEQKRYAAGALLYKNLCQACHGEDGRGKDKLGGNLVDSRWVNGASVEPLIRILIHGKEGQIGLMPPPATALGTPYDDEQIASALTYIRRTWGHTGSAVSPLTVMESRGLLNMTKRNKPWTDAELEAPAPARGGGGGGGGRAAGGRAGGAAAPAGTGAPAAPPAPGRGNQ